MKKYLFMLVSAVFMLISTHAFSHSDAKAKHGGVVHSKYDLNFELVRGADGVILYVDDHGEAIATEQLSGKIMVLSAGGKAEAELNAAGVGKWVATGLSIADGAKVVVMLTDKNKDVMTVRYSF